jgi:hypothetical protein
MNFAKIVIETSANYRETTLFPWIPESDEKILVKLDAIPIKHMDKQYLVALSFPYKHNYIHLESNKNIFKVNLIHNSDELNLALFSCKDYNDFTYTLNDLKYKIPNNKFDDFKFNDQDNIDINHIDYYFKNFLSDYLPPMAYLKVQSDQPSSGSVLYNKINNTIYGILYCTVEDHIVIPSVAIKRLIEGIPINFKYSNFYADYELYGSSYTSGIKIFKSNYPNLSKKDIIIDINNMMIIKGKIKYTKINEWVPIEVYLWYEWFPNTSLVLKKSTKTNNIIELPFINFKDILNIPIKDRSLIKNMKLSYELLDYFYEKNMIISNPEIDEYIMNPYKKKELIVSVDEKAIMTKYIEPTEYTELNIIDDHVEETNINKFVSCI